MRYRLAEAGGLWELVEKFRTVVALIYQIPEKFWQCRVYSLVNCIKRTTPREYFRMSQSDIHNDVSCGVDFYRVLYKVLGHLDGPRSKVSMISSFH